jgi:uncharacterized protein YwgA
MNRENEQLIGPDLLLLLLAAPTKVGSAEGRMNGITRLEKLLFLASEEEEVLEGVEDPFEFRPYDFGPYSKEIYESVELLEEAGLLDEHRVLGGRALDEMEEVAAATGEREGVERQFVLTDHGKAVARLLARRNPMVSRKLTTIKDKYARMPLGRLVRYVYERYPRYAEKSKIRDQVLREHG